MHPGGPFWAKKDEHGWSIPKGEFEPPEEPRAAAVREFTEEMGSAPPEGPYVALDIVKTSGKWIYPYLVEGDFDPSTLRSNLITIEWPPRSGSQLEIPEVDQAQWFKLTEAETKLHKGQVEVVSRIRTVLTNRNPT